MLDQDYIKFIEKVNGLIGIDLSLYKESQMNRRLRTLYLKKGLESYDEYFKAIKSNKNDLNEFMDRITINVTEFFRNPSRWDIVEQKAFPDLLEKNKKIKCWSAACSTGEEPYTIAMILNKYLPLSDIKIYATDLDEGVLEKARVGLYNENSFKNCSQEIIDKYFIRETEGIYRIKDELKNCVEFKRQNLLHDRFNNDFDFISCRNVMIYFTEDAKDELYKKFNGALKKGGIFFVGSTEQIFHPEKFGFGIYEPFFYIKK